MQNQILNNTAENECACCLCKTNNDTECAHHFNSSDQKCMKANSEMLPGMVTKLELSGYWTYVIEL